MHKRLDDSLSLEILEFSPPTPPLNTSSAGEATSLPASSIIEEVYPVAQAEADLFHNSPIHSNDLSTQLSYDQTSAESDRRTSFGTAIDEEAPKVSGEIAAPLAITAGCWEEIGAAEIPSRYDFALESQGCYRIPSAPVLKTFMHHYFLYVHPMLPVLNEGDFWDLHFPEIQTTSKTRQPSILLLQAMLFAACPVGFRLGIYNKTKPYANLVPSLSLKRTSKDWASRRFARQRLPSTSEQRYSNTTVLRLDDILG